MPSLTTEPTPYEGAHDPLFKDKDSVGIKIMSGLGILEPLSPTDIGEKKLTL
ncbi:MAG: hypothetical protein PHW73_06965 [Atribacterota bacterium]|nr:hypothetical protein [Atribacterota bacterium]